MRAKPEKVNPYRGMLSSGSTLLNCACSGRPNGAFARGGFYLVVGDSTSGKTVLAGTCFAEAAINTKFDDYELIFDNAEGGALMFEKFFGEKISARIQAPRYDKEGNPVCSRTVEEFYYNLSDCLKADKPCVYVLDSENALGSKAATDKFEEQKEAFEKGKDAAGSYGVEKARIHSQNLPSVVALLQDTGSILIVISQTRDNLGFGFEKKTRSGGKALKFYAMLEMWSSVKEHMKRTVKGTARDIGIVAEVRIRKNRFTGKDRSVTIPIYHSVGFDDIGACVDYLVQEKHWKVKDGEIYAEELGGQGTREQVVSQIEKQNKEQDIRALVGEVWAEIEAACEVHRKSRYQ